MSSFKLLKLKHFFFFQTVIAVIMVTQFMVIQNSISYFDAKEIKQRQVIKKSKEIGPLPICSEKTSLLLGQIFIKRGIKARGMEV
jgi:hypothetical protein